MTQTNTTQDLTEEQIQREINKRGGIDPRGKINGRRNKTTNTTQNKEELEVLERFKLQFDTDICKWSQDDPVIKFLMRERSQAHQSGIEEERKRIVEEVEKIVGEDFIQTGLDDPGEWRNQGANKIKQILREKIESLKEKH